MADIVGYTPGVNGGGAIEVEATRLPPKQGKPSPGEETDAQGDRVMYWGGGAAWNSLDASNPCAFEGWGQLYYGTYHTYRMMRRHPSIAHVRRQVFAAILSNTWGWEEMPGCPAGAYDLITRMFPWEFRLKTWAQKLFALDYGHAKFEKVWAYREGKWWIDRLKPLVVDRNEILVDKKGNYVGIQWGTDAQRLDRRKSYLYTYEGEAGALHGESRMENIRGTAWRDWLDAAQQLQWITQKLAGKLCIITTPSGYYTNAKGEKKSYKEAAQMAGKAITDPRSNGVVWFPTGALPDNIKKENIDLLKSPMVQIQVVDFGNHAAAIGATLERLKWNEGLMSQGYLRSPRTNQESQNGSRADGEVHTENDVVDMELIDGDMTRVFNEQVVDDVLAVNYGEGARGKVKAKPAKLTDEHAAMDGKIIDAVLATPGIVEQYLTEGVDVDAITDRRNIPKKKTTIVLKDVPDTNGDDAPPDPNADPEDDGGDDEPPRGGGRGSRASLDGDRYTMAAGGGAYAAYLAAGGARAPLADGQWVTIRGTHVFIKGGKITKGPASMRGKSPDEVGGATEGHGERHPAGRTKVGKGNTGDVFREGDEAVKASKGDEGKVYAKVGDVEGVAPGYQDGGEIRLPFYKNVASIDAVPEARRKGVAPIIQKNLDRLTNAVNGLSEAGYDYNDPLQVGFDGERRGNLFDFSNVEKVKPDDAMRSNVGHLKTYLDAFGLKEDAKRIGHTYDTLEGSKADADGREFLDDDVRARLNSRGMGENANGSKYAYYTKNARHVAIAGVAQSEPADGFKVILSKNPIHDADLKEWELTPVVHPARKGD